MLLIDRLDAQTHGEMWVENHRSSVEYDLSAFIGLVCARKNLDQGGLTGSVFAAQAMHLTFVQVERDILQRQYAGKGFRYISQLKDLAHGSITGAAWLVAGPFPSTPFEPCVKLTDPYRVRDPDVVLFA
jgi:hypothetical protein